jgi:hypothetical protein
MTQTPEDRPDEHETAQPADPPRPHGDPLSDKPGLGEDR